MQNIGYSITIEAARSPNDVFDCVNAVSLWWTKSAKEINSDRPTTFEGRSIKLNDEFILRHGDDHYSRHKVIEVMPNKKIVWRVIDSKLNWVQGNKEEWTGTKMVFEMVPREDTTVLTFTHEGLTPHLECYEHCVHFWDMVMKIWLFDLITHGTTK